MAAQEDKSFLNKFVRMHVMERKVKVNFELSISRSTYRAMGGMKRAPPPVGGSGGGRAAPARILDKGEPATEVVTNP